MVYERIRNLREDSDLTQEEFAKKLNISQRTLSYYESGTRNIPIDVLIRIADYFNCSTDYLLNRNNKKK